MFDKLFEPIKIGPVKIKNRIALSPMNMVGDRDRHPTNQYTCYFNARAQGGFGLLFTGSIITSKEASDEYPYVPALYRGSLNFGYYTDFVESVHSQNTDTKLFAQLSPGFGRQTGKRQFHRGYPLLFVGRQRRMFAHRQHDVLRNRQRGKQGASLKQHAYVSRLFCRADGLNCLAVEENFPGIRLVQANERLEQHRLA